MKKNEKTSKATENKNNTKNANNNKKSEVMKKETKKTAKNEAANIETTILNTCNNAVEKYGKGTPEAAQYAADTLFNMGIIPTPKKRQKIEVNGKSVYLHQYFYKSGVYMKSDTPKRINKATKKSCATLLDELLNNFIARGEKIGVQYNEKLSIKTFSALIDKKENEQRETAQKEQETKRAEKLENKLKGYNIADIEKYLNTLKASANA